MIAGLDERIDAYLNGGLSSEACERFECDLVRPEVAAAFAEALMLRELLRAAPPERPPADLVERLEASVVELLNPARSRANKERSLPRTRAALSGAAWFWRGPVLAFVGPGGPRQALSGLRTIRFALGPLASRRGAKEETEETKNKPNRRRSWPRRLLGRRR